MKAIQFSTLLCQSQALRSVRLALAAPALVVTLSIAHAGTPAPPTEDPTVGSNWIGFAVGGSFVSGNEAGMQRRNQTSGDFYGGIDTFHYGQDLKNSTTLTLDGHAMPGLEDYEFDVKVEKINLGYVKADYKQFRTWYDGSGGYMPQLASLHAEPARGDEMYVDRGEFNFEAGLRMENLPEITFNYKHTFRDGNKDSTSWGARPLVQSAGAGSLGTTNFEFAPSFWHLDEKSDIFGLEVEHTMGNTDLGLGLNYEHTSYTNSLNTRTGAVTQTTAGATTGNNQVASSFKDEYSMDLFAGNVHSMTRFNDTLWLSGGFAYTTVNTNTDGSQQLASPVNPGPLPGSNGSTTLRTIPVGGAEYENCVGNLNLMWNPIADLTVTPSLRIEQSSQSAIAQMNTTTTTNPYPPAVSAITLASQLYASDLSTHTDTAAMDLRYTGVSDLVLYAKGEWEHQNQSNDYNGLFYQTTSAAKVVAGGSLPDVFHEDVTVKLQDYTMGANWYPIRGLSFALQGLYSERNDEFDPSVIRGVTSPGALTGSQNLRPQMMDLDTTTDDVNLRATWHVLNNLSLVTRYDYKETEYDNRGVRWTPAGQNPVTSVQTPTPNPAVVTGPASTADNGVLPEVQSGIVRSNILSESLTWSPMARLYLQASASYTWAKSSTDTQMVPDSQNDYLTGSLSVGYAIDDRTDLTASYTFYDAKNYTQQGAPYTATATATIPYAMGYGLNTQEQTLSLTLNRRINANVSWNLRYSVMTSQTTGAVQDQSGGFNDYTAQMVSTGLQVRF